MNKIYFHVTVHNNDGQMIDYTCLPLVDSDLLFPEALKKNAKFTLDNGEYGVWVYDNGDFVTEEIAVSLARHIVKTNT